MQTVVADQQKRVLLPDAKPSQVFDYSVNAEGTVITLTVVKQAEPKEPILAKVRFEKRGRYTVGVSDTPVNMEAVKELLADFP